MKTKHLVFACIIVFLAIAGFLLWKNDIRVNSQNQVPTDKNFDHWRVNWEKQRQE